MPLQPWMKLLSTDDHLIEHPRVWSDRLPAKYQEAGPRIVERRGRGRPPAQVWVYEGRVYPQIGLNAVAGKKPEEFGTEPLRYDDMLPGCYDPEARLVDMDLDGVQAALCFPSFPRFAGTVFLDGRGQGARPAVRAGVERLHARRVVRHRARPLHPARDHAPVGRRAAASPSSQRTAAKGARAISFPENPAPLGLPSFHTDHWDPVFSAWQRGRAARCRCTSAHRASRRQTRRTPRSPC